MGRGGNQREGARLCNTKQTGGGCLVDSDHETIEGDLP